MNETPKDWVGGPYPCVQSPLVPPRACMRGNEVSQMVDGPSIICEGLKLAPYHRALKMAQLAGSCSSKLSAKIGLWPVYERKAQEAVAVKMPTVRPVSSVA